MLRIEEGPLRYAELTRAFKVCQIDEGPLKYSELTRDL